MDPLLDRSPYRLSEGEKALVVRSEGAITTPSDLEQIATLTGSWKLPPDCRDSRAVV